MCLVSKAQKLLYIIFRKQIRIWNILQGCERFSSIKRGTLIRKRKEWFENWDEKFVNKEN